MTREQTAPAILARRVDKSFGEHRVLDQVDLTVAEGTICEPRQLGCARGSESPVSSPRWTTC
jgi:hypothetical protein